MTNLLSQEEKRQLQLVELEILKVVKSVCDKYQLKYYLTAGTLLGAVRHQGFIPWDDDIDIVMPRSDYERFREIAPQALPKEYYYQDCYTEPNFPYFFAKVRLKDTEVFEPSMDGIDIQKGIYIDIFPLDVCPDTDRASKVFFKYIAMTTIAYLSKVDKKFVCGYTKAGAKLVHNYFRLFSLDALREKRMNKVNQVANRNSGNKLCTVGGAHNYPAESYQKEWFEGEASLLFEDEYFPVPSNWDALLRNMYGEYMKAPDIEEQKGHFENK